MSPDKCRDLAEETKAAQHRDSHQYTCGDCIAKPPAWHTLIALCQYEYPVSRLIHKLKYNGKFAHARILSQLLLDKIQATQHSSNTQTVIDLPECIIPIPLHPSRQKQRGFNQAIELARPIAKILRIKLEIDLCKRNMDTASQSSLEHEQRLYNLHDAFSLNKIAAYKHVAIFDDVVTTGSTVRSLCKLLYNAGVKRVDVWCIARASKND